MASRAGDLRLNLKQLRECFRKDVIGDKKSAEFSQFWRAVQLYSSNMDISRTKVSSSRPLNELQTAYDLVCSLLYDQPHALATFRANATAPIASPVPALAVAVNTFIERATAGPVCALVSDSSGYTFMCVWSGFSCAELESLVLS
jgi:hypothetical protein